MNKMEFNEDIENIREEAGAEGKPAEEAKRKETTLEEGEETEEVSKVKEELAASKDKYIRLYSEFENFRKRTAREKLELIQSANEQLLIALLPVIDDFERAEKAAADKSNQDVAGFFLIQSKFKKVLELYGVKVMHIQAGSDFDADFHEAITQIPAPKAEWKGKIVEVIEKGYLLNDKVIRYAKVVVGN